MINVVVIDDESVILRNFTKLIEKTDSNFKVIGTATNGRDGIDVIKKADPDIVFVDISMPVINGIDMIEKVREFNKELFIVILSGYSEFEIAKKALKYNVLEYLVKPINPLEFPIFLDSVKGQILDKKINKLKESIKNSIYSDSTHICTDLSSHFYLIKICFGAYSTSRSYMPDNSLPKLEDIEKAILKTIYKDNKNFIFNELVDNEWLIVIERNTGDIKLQIELFYKSLKSKFNNYCNITLIHSSDGSKLTELNREYNLLNCRIIKLNKFDISTINILESSELDIKIPQEIISKIQHLKNLPAGLNLSLKKELVSQIINLCRSNKIYQFQLNTILIDVLNSLNYGSLSSLNSELVNMTIINSNNYEHLIFNVLELITECNDTFLEKNSSSKKSIALKIKRYIDNHYKENITVQEMSDLFELSYSYLCVLFKKELNQSPNEYLISKKIEVAMELLKDETSEIREIALAIGYEDPYYFSRIFKSNTGVSPTIYRKQLVSN